MHNCPCSTSETVYPEDADWDDAPRMYYGPHSLEPSTYLVRTKRESELVTLMGEAEWFTPCSAHEQFYFNNKTFESKKKD
jgi:hypothetical protein